MIDKSEKFVWAVRGGYAARGVVYILIGYLALAATGAANEGPEAAFDVLQEIPLGSAVLYLMAVGLLAYAAFKFLSGVSDLEGKGSDTKAVVTRAGSLGSAVAHVALALTAVQFARGDKQSAGGTDTSREVATTLLTWDMGWLLLGLIGLGFLAAAAFQARNAVTAHFMRAVDTRAPAAVCWIGRAGHAARAIVFAIIGWSLLRSGWFTDGSEVKGLGEALVSLSEQSAVYQVVAAGLILFGIFSLIVARFRIIPDISREDLRPRR